MDGFELMATLTLLCGLVLVCVFTDTMSHPVASLLGVGFRRVKAKSMNGRHVGYWYVIRIWPLAWRSIEVGMVCGTLRSAAVVDAAKVNVGVNEGDISLEIIAV
ncbi:MAG: hypothetical protein VX223_07825 [Myxococcota bacterium]|nr:hypothetical protein [Myxococcota bacterium]